MRKGSILIVDDNEEYLRLVECIVEQAGIKVHYATSAEEALGILKEGCFATLIADINMLDMDGYELAVIAKELCRMAKVLKLSDAQIKQAGVILTAEKERVAPLREKLMENRKKLHEAAEGETFDEAAVKTLAASQAGLQAELIVSRLYMQSQLRAILTSKQRDRINKDLITPGDVNIRC